MVEEENEDSGGFCVYFAIEWCLQMRERNSSRSSRQQPGEEIQIVKRVYVFLRRNGSAEYNPKHIDIVCSHFEFHSILHSICCEEKLIYFNPLKNYIKLKNIFDITR